jgi:outer membrane protein OmpA-like peptidoglycan-associated protein
MRFQMLSGVAIAAALALSACASTAPKELVDARTAYAQAESSQAASLAPADLQTAREALGRAESSFTDNGDDQVTRALSYVALRKAELAEVKGNVVAATNAKEQAQKDLLNTATGTAESKSKQLEKTTDQLNTERTARIEAEKRMKDAMARLAAIATMKEDNRGTVITIPGGVLFESGKSVLFPTAQEKLNQVADALLQNRDSTMVVEGHTDSQGNDDANMKLSQDRANSVREYLVSRGVATDRITSVGKGETTPIADNKSPEGRANNRRVEIVVSGQTDKK